MEFLKELKRAILILNNEETESDSLNQGGSCGRRDRMQVYSPRTVFCLVFFSIKPTSMTAS